MMNYTRVKDKKLRVLKKDPVVVVVKSDGPFLRFNENVRLFKKYFRKET